MSSECSLIDPDRDPEHTSQQVRLYSSAAEPTRPVAGSSISISMLVESLPSKVKMRPLPFTIV